MRQARRNKLGRSRAGTFFIMLFLVLMGCFTALPFVYSILQSIKPLEELFVFPPRMYVVRPTFENYISLFNLTTTTWVPVSRYLFNSAALTVLGTAANVLFSSMAAYPLAKLKFHGSKQLFNLVVVSLLFTYEVTSVPAYIIIAKLF